MRLPGAGIAADGLYPHILTGKASSFNKYYKDFGGKNKSESD